VRGLANQLRNDGAISSRAYPSEADGRPIECSFTPQGHELAASEYWGVPKLIPPLVQNKNMRRALPNSAVSSGPVPSNCPVLAGSPSANYLRGKKKCQKLHVRSAPLTLSRCVPRGRITHNPHQEGPSPFPGCPRTSTLSLTPANVRCSPGATFLRPLACHHFTCRSTASFRLTPSR
jgi:hypothetical protein